MVRAEGLEPPRLTPPEPKSGVSTSFTTPAGREAAELPHPAPRIKARPCRPLQRQETKVFCFFFSKKKKENFFFEKKKQKTLVPVASGTGVAIAKGQRLG